MALHSITEFNTYSSFSEILVFVCLCLCLSHIFVFFFFTMASMTFSQSYYISGHKTYANYEGGKHAFRVEGGVRGVDLC